jgi:hypothetical protein
LLAPLLALLAACSAPLVRARPDVDAALAVLRSSTVSGERPIASELVDGA